MGGDLYKTGLDLIIKQCVREDEMHDILKASHDGPYGGHFSNKRTAYKIPHSGYYWPTLFRDEKGMFKVATVVKGWGNPSKEMKCLCSPRFS